MKQRNMAVMALVALVLSGAAWAEGTPEPAASAAAQGALDHPLAPFLVGRQAWQAKTPLAAPKSDLAHRLDHHLVEMAKAARSYLDEVERAELGSDGRRYMEDPHPAASHATTMREHLAALHQVL